MTDLRSLEYTLPGKLPWHRARIKFVARFLQALYAVQAVNLLILANAFFGSAQVESHDKRRQRFLREFEMPDAEAEVQRAGQAAWQSTKVPLTSQAAISRE